MRIGLRHAHVGIGTCACVNFYCSLVSLSSRGMLAGPGGLLGAAEGLSYLSLAAGAVVLVLQVPTYRQFP